MTVAVPSALTQAVEILPELLDPAPLVRALRVWEEPWRVAIVGRVGVGKSTLLNLLAGERVARTGLGGITREAMPAEVRGAVVVDTVGIDDEAGALAALQPLLEEVDAVLWLVDGLQPLTATERRVVEASLVPGMPLDVVISKLDLADDADPPRVLERVRALTEPLRPRSVQRLDLRALTPDDPRLDALVQPDPAPSPRRVRPLLQALDQLQAELDAQPTPPDRPTLLRQLRERWSAHVRAVERDIDALIEAGSVDNKVLAVDRLARLAGERQERFVVEMAADPTLARYALPELPLPDRPEVAPLGQVVASMSGREGARRALRAAAARWMVEGEVVLMDWVDAQDDLDAAHQRHVRVQGALSRAREAIPRPGEQDA